MSQKKPTPDDPFYVLEDGSRADPTEVALDEKGVLKHKSGKAVSMRSPGVPMTSGAEKAKGKEVKPEPEAKTGYKTRESKSE